MVYAAYIEGIRARDRQGMLEVIPADELVIQLDFAWEFVDMAIGERNYFPFWPEAHRRARSSQRHAEQLSTSIWQGIPDETPLGYHWCYGTWGGWPMTAMQDLDLCVPASPTRPRSAADRRIDYIHMPVIRQPGPGFFAPLDDLDIGDTKVYLGLIHHTDGVDGTSRGSRRHASTSPTSGSARVCGYGRVDPGELPLVLDVHAACAREMRAG